MCDPLQACMLVCQNCTAPRHTHMHTARTHTRAPQTELNHRSERDLRVRVAGWDYACCGRIVVVRVRCFRGTKPTLD